MSILVIEVLPQGMIFAADRAVTVTAIQSSGSQTRTYQAQKAGSKILRWPHDRALIGAVGLGEIEGKSTYDWLFDFMGDHIKFSEPEDVASDLQRRLHDKADTRYDQREGAKSWRSRFRTTRSEIDNWLTAPLNGIKHLQSEAKLH